MPTIGTCLWFNQEAEQAAKLYTSLFQGGRILGTTYYTKSGDTIEGRPPADTVMTVTFEIAGRKFMGLNGGPKFFFTPAISFFVTFETEAQLDKAFKELLDGGTLLMPLSAYPFSKKFAWVNDRWGVSWQLHLSGEKQMLSPYLMFVGDQFGRAEEAIKHYISQFENSEIVALQHGAAGASPDKESVKIATFTLDRQSFMAMDSNFEHNFSFTQATSFVAYCKTQEQIDKLWTGLSADGREVQCGWLVDKFGVSWQIVPEELGEMLHGGNRQKNESMMQALLQMTKLDIAKLRAAYDRG